MVARKGKIKNFSYFYNFGDEAKGMIDWVLGLIGEGIDKRSFHFNQ